MAKAVYIVVRNHDDVFQIKKKVEVATKKLIPDNIPEASCKIVENGNIIYGIANYTDVIAEHDGSICMGIAYPEEKNWWKPLDAYPDGSFAIFRSDEKYVEAVTDTTASRTIWYYKDDKIFICATSQRAIITILGKFDFDKRVIPWMISSGSLGPTLSWCKNLSRLEPQASLLLNRQSWELSKKSEPVIFSAIDITPQKQYEKLKESLINSFNDFQFDLTKWVLPLSGGYDSRSIACLLKASGKNLAKIDSVTWGLKESLNKKYNDAYVASILAKELGMQHQYFAIDKTEENIETVFKRFILNSEGRVDNIEGYTDGFNLWKILFDNKKQGIIRGDESFGWAKVTDAKRARVMVGLTLCEDFSNLENYQSYGFEKQELPAYLSLRKSETPQMLIDRYYVSFRIPTVMAALNDLKLSYVEVVNPLLSRQILMQMRTISDSLRVDRKAFIEAMKELVPDIKYATEDATHVKGNIFKIPEAIALMKQELSADYMKEIFPEAFIKKVVDKLQQPEEAKKAGGFKNRLRKIIKVYFPSRLKESLYNIMGKPGIDNSTLAFRIYLTGRMYKQLTEDSITFQD
jgi:asparagine synthetase B (glutamine-hydrolysing)